jgi:hypothetical protein
LHVSLDIARDAEQSYLKKLVKQLTLCKLGAQELIDYIERCCSAPIGYKTSGMTTAKLRDNASEFQWDFSTSGFS